MTPEETEQLCVSIERQMDEHIRHFGWGVMGVFDDSDPGPTHAYTVGLVLSHGFELAANAVISIKVIQPLLNELGMRIKKGHPWREGFSSDSFTVTVDGITYPLRVGVRKVSKTAVEEVTPFAFRRAETFDVYQLILADKRNILPTEDGYDVNFKQTLWPAVQ